MSEKFKVGQVWRARLPRNANGFVNDRVIKHISVMDGAIQYDGPAVAIGSRYPRVALEDFERWARREVKDELPEGEWQAWDSVDGKKNK